MQQRDRPQQPAMQHSYQRSADSTRSNASASLLVPSHIRTPSSEQFPNGVPLITRNAGGYFDTSSVHSRSFSPAATPRTSTDQPMTAASTTSSFQQTKEKSSFRRGSISSLFKPSHNRGDSSGSFLKRRDSNASSTTKASGTRGRTFSFSRRDSSASPAEGSRMRSSSRRGSIKEALRRASNDVSKGVKIVKLGPSERDKYVQKEKDKILREIEESRRQAPNTRPKYQQDYISERQRLPSSKPLDELSAADQILALERALQKQDEDALADAEVNPEKMAGEDFAFFISRVIDPLKSKKLRQDSDDSDLLFADIAPVEEMEDCERCGRPVTTALKDGLCERCYWIRLKGVEDWFDSPTQVSHDSDSSWSATSSHNSYMPRRSHSFSSNHSSPPSRGRQINEDNYIKLPSSRRIQRVRKTIYQDPGNPFLSDSPPLERRTSDSPAFRYDVSDDDEPWIFGEPSIESSAPLLAHEVDLPEISIRDSSFGPALISPSPRRISRLDETTLSSAVYSPEDAKIRRRSLPSVKKGLNLLGIDHEEKKRIIKDDIEVRNTKYYGFYDGVLDEYRR